MKATDNDLFGADKAGKGSDNSGGKKRSQSEVSTLGTPFKALAVHLLVQKYKC